MTSGEHTFEQEQFHFHTPSENNVNDEFFAMEAHLVPADEHGNLAVVGVFFSEGTEHPIIEPSGKHA